MKLIKILLLLFSSTIIFDAAAMKKRKEIEPEEAVPAAAAPSTPAAAASTPSAPTPEPWQATAPKKPKFDMGALERLPRDVQILTILEIVKTSKNINEAVKALQNLQATSKKLYTLINSDDVNIKLITALADRFLHGNALQAAGLLHSAASTEWSHLILPEYIRTRILKIIKDGIRDDYYPDEIISQIKLYMHSRPLIKKALHNEYAMIWLIRTISKYLNPLFNDINNEYQSATVLAAKLYPEKIESPQVQKWLAYADNQIANADEIQQDSSLEPEVIKKNLQNLTAQGIDIVDDLVTPSVVYSHYRNPQVLQLFIDAGVTLNEQDANGNTILHDLVNEGNIVEERPGVFSVSERSMNPQEQENRFKLFEFLLRSGANPTIKNNEGKTAFISLLGKYRKLVQAAGYQQPGVTFYEQLSKLFSQYGARF